LSYLHRLPVDAVKIDRSFLTELDVAGDGAKSRRAVMRAIIAMVRTLDLDIIVEGIDSGTQAIALAEMGAGFGQGYYFAAPAPKAITLDRLRQGRLGL
jgi:EAL domain-containing protein (putative c-di-GMP-specific phosphodiesterase class I)